MKVLQSGRLWPSPEEWRTILGERVTDVLLEDAKHIIKTGRSNELVGGAPVAEVPHTEP